MVYNSKNSTNVLEKSIFEVWFNNYEINYEHCEIVEYFLSSSDDCLEHFTLPSAKLNPDFTLNPTFPTQKIEKVNVCSKSITGHYGYFTIYFDICGNEKIKLNTTLAKFIDKEYKLSKVENDTALI